MLLSAVSVLVVAQSSSEIPEGLTNTWKRIRKFWSFSEMHKFQEVILGNDYEEKGDIL